MRLTIIITLIMLVLLSFARVCEGDYVGDTHAVCSDRIGTILINKIIK